MAPTKSPYLAALAHLDGRQYCWAITGVAGFIGSHLLETLLRHGQRVVGLDSFITGSRANLEQVRLALPPRSWDRFRFIEGDIRSATLCQGACEGADFVLHQAALGSVPRSIEQPLLSSDINIMGFLNVLCAARDRRVRRFVYAASSAVYGDHSGMPKVECQVGRPLSPYGLSKFVNELYADVFARCYGMQSVGLRYFNVFGPRQDPKGPYAAVIPQWIAAMIDNTPVLIHGDGSHSRDFCYVANAVQANILACLSDEPAAVNQVYNVAVGARTRLDTLCQALHALLAPHLGHLTSCNPTYGLPRPGDIAHSQADISKAGALLGYIPSHRLEQGLAETVAWHLNSARSGRADPFGW